MAYLFSTSLLTGLYLLLTGDLSLINLIYGALLSALITLLLRPSRITPDFRRLPGAIWGLLRYVVLLIYDLVLAGIQITRIVLDPKLPIQPGIAEIPAECDSELAVALSIHALTLTPGELVVNINDQKMLQVHFLDTSNTVDKVKQAHRLRENLLRDIFI
jgi:multisubunit Na+/H+ antiporter MnhE subunit